MAIEPCDTTVRVAFPRLFIAHNVRYHLGETTVKLHTNPHVQLLSFNHYWTQILILSIFLITGTVDWH